MKTMQFTVRGVPERLDRELRSQARKQRKSLNKVLLNALEKGAGIGAEVRRYHDLDDLAGTWVEDPAFDQAIAEMDRVDPELWK